MESTADALRIVSRHVTDRDDVGARARLTADAQAIIERYPVPRSALLPMLHLVQSEEGFVSPDGIAFCAEQLGLTTAEVAAVATFYTHVQAHPNGNYTSGSARTPSARSSAATRSSGPCPNTWASATTRRPPDGAITLEQIECNAACDYAPVVMVNWEFFDNQTPASTRDLADQLRAGERRCADPRRRHVCTFKQMSRVLAGFNDGRAHEGVGAGGDAEGLRLAKERGWTAPTGPPARAGRAGRGTACHRQPRAQPAAASRAPGTPGSDGAAAAARPPASRRRHRRHGRQRPRDEPRRRTPGRCAQDDPATGRG